MAQGMFSFITIFTFQIRNPNFFPSDGSSTNMSNTTSSSADDPLDVARSIIDRDIARLEESVRVLKFRRNGLAPISRLPVEILCNIFSLSILSRPESWTNFSQVSRHWRSLALSAPELWTNIPVNYPRWAQEMLIRSKKAKLTIRSGSFYETSRSKTIETIRSCLYEMNRVEEIHIAYGITASALKEIFCDLPKSAPQLHTLCIGSSSSYISGHVFPIHEDFLYDTERLQRVELINCKISWESPLLTGLTRLTLESQYSLISNSSINQFLHALQRMPALTDLRLKDYSIPDDSESPSTYPVVDLPCLRVLNILSGVDALTAVLRHITFPHSAVLNLTCKEKQSTQIDFSNFLSVLATKFLSSLVFRSLSLQVLDSFQSSQTRTYGLEFCLWTTATIHDHFPSTQSQLRLVLAWPSSQISNLVNNVKALTCAFDAMSLPFLTQLRTVSNFNHVDPPTWVKIFEKLPLLEWVCVQSYASGFLEAMVQGAEKSKTVYRNILLLKLRYIYLVGVDFDAQVSGISVDMLLDYLMERCERDAEVQTLRLERCYSISSDDVAKLKEIVVDVVWSGNVVWDE